MNWNKAVAKIEQALNEGANVAVQYHRKWMKNDSHIHDVEEVVEYEYKGKVCKALNLWGDQIDEGSHIIDQVLTDYFFGITWKAE